MIELDYQLGYQYRLAMIFAVLANVAGCPAWQSDVLAERMQAGAPAPARRGGVRSAQGTRTQRVLPHVRGRI
jgi:hypothetical protein